MIDKISDDIFEKCGATESLSRNSLLESMTSLITFVSQSQRRMAEDIRVREQWQILQYLRSTVEGLLNNGLSNVWNVYCGLSRLHNAMERIFKHGSRIFDPTGEPDCWIFIQGLNWLQPSLATSPIIRECDDYFANLPNKLVTRKDMLWLHINLENHTLSQKLSWLLSDKEHLLSCFEPWAFLCQETLTEATLLCLKAVEKNQPALLTEIDPCLFLPDWNRSKNNHRKFHRRTSSYPVSLKNPRDNTLRIPEEACQKCSSVLSSCVFHDPAYSRKILTEEREFGVEEKESKLKSLTLLRTWKSVPNFNRKYESLQEKSTSTENISHKISKKGLSFRLFGKVELSTFIRVDYSEPNDIVSPSEKNTPKQKAHLRKGRIKSGIYQDLKVEKKDDNESSETLNHRESSEFIANESLDSTQQLCVETFVTNSMKIKTPNNARRKSSLLAGSTPEFTAPWSLEIEGQKDNRTPKKRFMEDGGSSVQPMATGYFPRPLEGQSIMSFLSTSQFSRGNAELDRENAHFSISEAIIAAIEKVKCNRQLHMFEENVEESDEEINDLKQKIRLRRQQRQEERRKGLWVRDLLSDGKTDTTTTDQSVSPLSTSPGTLSNSISTDIDDTDSDDTNLQRYRISASTTSLYSKVDLLISSSPRLGLESHLTDSTVSAEGVALSLISRFSDKHLPRASELKWLVSEQDAPQQLLPLPKSWSINLKEKELNQENETCSTIPLRGTMEWAPPRPQIIFTQHPPPVRRILIAKQNYRCAGCGMKVAIKYAKRFRYCEYLGRYFCTGCHTNQVALIPGRILYKWDFNRYPVSNFSYRLLDQMAVDPLFQVNDLNPSLYRRIKQLERTRLLRTQLVILKDFLFNCRFATSLQGSLREEPSHLLNDSDVYSIEDFTHLKLGILPIRLQKLIKSCTEHIRECMLCQARGFICEFCFSKDVIYPWELNKVSRCQSCGSCFHIICKTESSTKECPRCVRIEARRLSKQESF